MSRRSATRRFVSAVAAVVALAVVASCSASGSGSGTRGFGAPTTSTTGAGGETGSTTTTDPDGADTLEWTSCDGSFECATLDVPVDYDDPAGDQLGVAMVRRPATGDRIGTLFFNPGGPGGSGIDTVESLPLRRELTERFDLIGVDPRGVGRSNPLDCRTHLQDIYTADPTIEDEADATALLEASQDFVDECEEKYGELLPFLGTAEVARDMDAIRAAMGEEQISYVGYSYGTSIGQEYAQLFPTRVRAMVIDGVVDLSKDGIEAAEGQAAGFTVALDAYIADCAARSGGCGLDGPADEAIDAVVALAENEPIPAADADRPAGPGEVSLALAQALYSETLWSFLSTALADALDGDGSGIVDLADDYLRRNADGSYGNGFEIYFAVSCLDQEFPRDPDALLAAGKAAAEESPRFGEEIVNDYVRCALWPTPAKPLTPVPADTVGLPPIVVISTTGDPATPYENGVRAAEQIPDAVLVTNVGEGHTIFAQGKPCIDDAVTTYLVELEPPEDGLRCE